MEQAKIVLCDTDVIIEFYRNNPAIVSELKKIGQENIAISVITAGELIFGAVNKKELTQIKKDLDHLIVLAIDEDTSWQFIAVIQKYALSHRLSLPDGLIAATAIKNNINLFSLNKKDFRYIEGLRFYEPAKV